MHLPRRIFSSLVRLDGSAAGVQGSETLEILVAALNKGNPAQQGPSSCRVQLCSLA